MDDGHLSAVCPLPQSAAYPVHGQHPHGSGVYVGPAVVAGHGCEVCVHGVVAAAHRHGLQTAHVVVTHHTGGQGRHSRMSTVEVLYESVDNLGAGGDESPVATPIRTAREAWKALGALVHIARNGHVARSYYEDEWLVDDAQKIVQKSIQFESFSLPN